MAKVLSEREWHVAKLVAFGKSNAEIGQILGLREHTVKNYVYKIFDKLGHDSRAQLAVWYALSHQDEFAAARPGSGGGNK